MAFVSMMFVFLLIAAAILGGMLLGGTVLLIVGFLLRRNPKYAGKNAPTACIVAGGVLIGLPATAALFLLLSVTLSLFGISL